MGTLTVDIEKVVSDHLRNNSAVAAIVNRRVVGKTPQSTDQPWVTVTDLDGPGDVIDHLVRFMVQFDCYAGRDGGQPEANLLGRTVRAALMDLNGDTEQGVMSGVSILGFPRVPDPAFDPMRERRVGTAYIWAHP